MEYSNNFKFLIPSNDIAIVINLILIVFFILWFYNLSKSWYQLILTRKELTNCYNVDLLTEAIHSTSSADVNNTFDYLKSKTDAVMNLFANERKINASSPIYTHIRALFEAGMFESRLDSNELLKTTTGELFKINTALRTILSSFIVLGLLGTLFGLADSLNYLSLNDPKIGQTGSYQFNIIKETIDGLFSRLGNAFAPSLLGTLLTVVGICIYTAYLHFTCHTVHNLLNVLTNTVWIPRLIPTTSQRALESLRLSQITMNQTLDATKTVADFAKNIEGDVSDFGKKIKDANKTLKTLSGYGDQMQNVVTSFENSIRHVVTLQEGVSDLTKHFFTTVQSHQQQLDSSKEQLLEFHALAKETFAQQGEQINKLLAAIQSYETNYAGEREQTDESIKLVLNENRTAIEQIEKRNKEIIEELGKPLLNTLMIGLKHIENSSANQLALIVKKLGEYDIPLRDTVTRMSGTLETVVKRTDILLQGIQRETLAATQAGAEHIKRVGELIIPIKESLEQISKDPKKNEMQKDTGLEKAITELNRNVLLLRNHASSTPIHDNPIPVSETSDSSKKSWIKVAGILACVAVILGAAAGIIGYWQYQMMDTIAEIQNNNKRIVTEIDKLAQPAAIRLTPLPQTENSVRFETNLTQIPAIKKR